MTFQEVQRHIDSFARPAGFDVNAWRAYKKMALLIWEGHLTGQPWQSEIRVPCRQFFFMLHDKKGRCIVQDMSLLNWLDNDWNCELVKRLEERGVEHMNVGAHSAAMLYFDRALMIDPKKGSLLNHRGWVKQQQKDFQGALADFSTAIELDPLNDSAYVNRAALYSLMDMDSKAMDDLNKAIALNPANGTAYSTRGALLSAQNRDEALTDLKKAASIDPANKRFLKKVAKKQDDSETKTAA